MADLSFLLPWEFSAVVRGYHRRLRCQREQAAEAAAWGLMPYCGGSLTAADLLGESETSGTVTLNPSDYPNKDAFLAAVEEVRAAHADQRR